MAGVGGRLTAFILLVGLVVAGLGAALAASIAALTVTKWVGVAYLAWLGLPSLRSARRARSGGASAATPVVRKGLWPLVVNEFAVGISNPQALLLFAALLPQFADETADGFGLQITLLSAAYVLIEFILSLAYLAVGCLIGATAFSARAAPRRRRQRHLLPHPCRPARAGRGRPGPMNATAGPHHLPSQVRWVDVTHTGQRMNCCVSDGTADPLSGTWHAPHLP